MDKGFFDLFVVPEKTKAGYSFADTPVRISFQEAKVAVYGVPLDATTSFGRGTARGPEAIRLTSARQIETFVLDEKADVYELSSIFDLGDLKMPPKNKGAKTMFAYLDRTIPQVVSTLRENGKIPVMLGGEHTLSYYQLKVLAGEEPFVIHFDAHRDMKAEYEGMKMCHTTPFYHLLEYIPGKDLVQIGIRQTDREENDTAIKNGVTTFDAWQVHDDLDKVADFLAKKTAGRNIYISFDIDAYDLPYVPCTGTPEPYGLDPFQVLRLIKAVHPSARLIGMDMVEVGLKNDDYREGALATQTLLRILARKYAR
ncbi:arginase family hydrolase, arginase/agmainase/formiminoglutamate hydrolase [Candidatus Nitrososphaera evergladensis SR1]|uniref:Arginase family hydrolase, arginase/agmainase/formiminoglutamate hydrolase n=1 Tax=Candidatus Nitrososphaera evergladensis SR1 TaxID=1459636 RepID=A0A075MMV0_9ARCH|nr:arginase family protein [Candidatus Nitrososphaera evergladensis]AIF82761.1 arginase family hydrolase, arginase/agmainase/formiminoglutamate hydrolase [Candidatus Nitrososphaera evergladensis SR1]